ncbi:zinc dependent phospholipase C family protein [Haloplasma contractile]|uniref:Zinc dependent phospholipase C protein n=1 Tax=Haloplasma contractile SSD-17B TaxID=1033810 RepID=U2FLP7_9MOLU|nr:zinc dependent phospholipase C family protein [Haloplasma contractile]ERJ12114.1 Zinc dependent phospholipase C protein [Haloplasma contractile SSD-17B]
MKLPTHKRIAKYVHNEINKSYKIELDLKYFTFGNIRPDIDPRLVKKIHRLKGSLDYVVSEIERVIETDYTSMKKFSMDLGIIMHFLSDFFCAVHYHEDTTGLITLYRHLKYEGKLKKDFPVLAKNTNIILTYSDLYRVKKTGIRETIMQHEQSYSKLAPRIENDIYFVLKITKLISLYVIDNCKFFNKEAHQQAA